MNAWGGAMFDEAAKAIGISVDQLRRELQGKSLAQVAQDHNVQPSAVAQALKNAANAHIDQAVQSGRKSGIGAVPVAFLPGDQLGSTMQLPLRARMRAQSCSASRRVCDGTRTR